MAPDVGVMIPEKVTEMTTLFDRTCGNECGMVGCSVRSADRSGSRGACRQTAPMSMLVGSPTSKSHKQ